MTPSHRNGRSRDKQPAGGIGLFSSGLRAGEAIARGEWPDEFEDPTAEIMDLVWLMELVRVDPPGALYVLGLGMEEMPITSAAELDPESFHYLVPSETVRRVNGRTFTIVSQEQARVSYTQRHVVELDNLEWSRHIYRIRALTIARWLGEDRPQPWGFIRWDHRGHPVKSIIRIDWGGEESTEKEVVEQLKAMRVLERGYPRLGAPPDPDAMAVRNALASGNEAKARQLIMQQEWYREREKQIAQELTRAREMNAAGRTADYREHICRAEDLKTRRERALRERLRRARNVLEQAGAKLVVTASA